MRADRSATTLQKFKQKFVEIIVGVASLISGVVAGVVVPSMVRESPQISLIGVMVIAPLSIPQIAESAPQIAEFAQETHIPQLETFPDARLAHPDRYPVTVDRSWSTSSIRSLADASSASTTINKLIECESQYTAVKRLDKNGLYSYGVGQFQSSTWNGWEKEFNFDGDPMSPPDAIKMMEMAIQRGYLYHWSCAYLMGLLKK